MDTQNMERKNLDFEIKEVDASGKFAGYANTWEKDLGGDTIKPGAFKKTIREHKGKIPILKGHDSSVEIGMTNVLTEDEKGLVFEGQLYIDDANPKNEVQAAREEYVRMKRRQELGKPMGISIGFTIPNGKSEYDQETGERSIGECALWEMSTTPFPMNQSSRVAEVKSLPKDELVALIDERIKSLSSLPPAADPAKDQSATREADTMLTEPEFHSMMKRLGIPTN